MKIKNIRQDDKVEFSYFFLASAFIFLVHFSTLGVLVVVYFWPLVFSTMVKPTGELLTKLRGVMKNTSYVSEALQAYIIPSEDAHQV